MEHQEFELTLNGYRYYYRMLKCDNEMIDPIFFLSGAFQSMDSWDRFIKYFRDKTTLIFADLPGGGTADTLPENYGLDFLVASVGKILNHSSIPRVNILSASYGTPIAYEFAKQNPYQVSHLGLVGIMREIPIESKASVHHTITLLRQNRVDEFADEVLNGLLCMDPFKEVNKRNIVSKFFRRQLQSLTPNQIEKYISNTIRLLQQPPLNIDQSPNVPTLVFTGEYDSFTKPDYCKEIADSFKNARFTTIKNADHLCHLEQFNTVIQLFDRFYFDESLDNIPGCNDIEYIRQ